MTGETIIPWFQDWQPCCVLEHNVTSWRLFLGKIDYIRGDASSKGPEWFNQCQKSVSETGHGPINFSSTVVKDFDRNTT